MISIPITELSGAQLDLAVALCEGLEARIENGQCVAWPAGSERMKAIYSPSIDPVKGHVILEREKIDICPMYDNVRNGVRVFRGWWATHPKNYGGLIRFSGSGSTILEAGMRAYVHAYTESIYFTTDKFR